MSDPLSLLRTAVEYAIGRLNDFSKVHELDEETLTAAFLGALGTAIPLLAWQYQVGNESGESSLAWGTYRKAAPESDEAGERSSGADFWLVIWESADAARVAVFQAKKAKWSPRHKVWRIDVSRLPKSSQDAPKSEAHAKGTVSAAIAESAQRMRSQMAKLVATAHRLTALRTNLPSPPSQVDIATLVGRMDDEEIDAIRSRCGWIHYLAYAGQEARAVPLSGLPLDVLISQCRDPLPRQMVATDARGVELLALLAAGLAPSGGSSPGWELMSVSEVKALLPHLLELMPVHTGGSKDGPYRDLEPQFQDAFETPPPTPPAAPEDGAASGASGMRRPTVRR